MLGWGCGTSGGVAQVVIHKDLERRRRRRHIATSTSTTPTAAAARGRRLVSATHATTDTQAQHREGLTRGQGLRSHAVGIYTWSFEARAVRSVGYPEVAVLVGLLLVLVPPCLPASPPKAAREEAGRAEGGGPCSGLGTTGFSAPHTHTHTLYSSAKWSPF